MIGYLEYKYKFFDISQRILKSILILLIVLILSFGSTIADVKPTEVDFGLAVVIDQNSFSGEPERLLEKNNLILNAIENYCYHYLNQKGSRFEVFVSENRDKEDSLISSLSKKYFTKIIIIKPHISYFSRNKIVNDNHGRKYFKTILNNLELKINYIEYHYFKGDWIKSEIRRINETGKREWYDTEIKYMRGNASITGRAEPYEFVIQRAIEKIFDNISLTDKKSVIQNKSIPLKIYSGNNLKREERENNYHEIINFASPLFNNQFGFVLKFAGMENLDSLIDEDSLYSIQLNSGNLFFRDTIRTYIFEQFDFLDYFNSGAIREIGYSRLGNKAIRIKLYPDRKQSDFDWNSYFNSLTMLHEIGHSFGAIHALDINSIMNYSYSWVGPKHYDPVNAKIIEASLQGRIHPSDAAKYVAFISKTLKDTDYGLIDFPSFFYNFLKLEKNKKYLDKLRNAIWYRPYLLAIDGYAMIQEGSLEKAANLFREAIRYEPDQASLYYYLSLVTQGKESMEARLNALRMGYVDAID